MSLFHVRHRLQEANPDNSGGNQQQQQQQPTPAEWLKPFGEHAKVFEGIKDPAELATKWTAANTELTTLKAKPQTFDFRKELGGEDEAVGKLLSRYTEPKAIGKALLEASNKIRSGELAKPIDMSKATPEQIAEWRTANGIPAEAKGYWEKLPEGLVIGKDDQGVFDVYGALAHKHNAPPALMHEFAKAYYAQQAEVVAQEAKVDKDDQQKAVSELRNLYGNDYQANMALVNNWLAGMPGDLAAQFKDATLPNGKRLFNDSQVVDFIVSAARQLNPLAHVLPNQGEGGMKSLQTELDGLKKMMGDRNSEYWKGPKAEANQKRYRELTEARLALEKK